VGYSPETFPDRIEIIEPCGRAWRHMKEMLFPFDFGTWITLGFVAWLAMLGQGGASFNYRQSWRNREPRSAKEVIGEGMSWLEQNLQFVIVLVIVAVLVLTAIYLALAYLNARGVFMYVDCVVRRKAAVGEPWRRAGKHAWSFFLWRALLGVLRGVFSLLIVAATLTLIWSNIRAWNWTPETVSTIVVSGIALFLVAVAFELAQWCLRNLVAPIMYLRNVNGSEGWAELFELMRGRVGVFVLYWLLNVLLGLSAVVLSVAAVCCTCCLGALPVVFQTILQPLFLWLRAFPLYFLAQFGPAYALPGGVPAEEDAAESSAEPGMKIVACPQCGQSHQVPIEGRGMYACVKCGAHFEVG